MLLKDEEDNNDCVVFVRIRYLLIASTMIPMHCVVFVTICDIEVIW